MASICWSSAPSEQQLFFLFSSSSSGFFFFCPDLLISFLFIVFPSCAWSSAQSVWSLRKKKGGKIFESWIVL
jgi:hypothetical protein